MNKISHFLIAAPSSHSGKTTLTLGLLRAMKNRGQNVQPYKCGPDYIDTKFHQLAAGNSSINLDSFYSSPEDIVSLYAKHACRKDVCITEGVMGLFDGYDRMEGSSARIAEVLDLPIVLVVDARSMAYSVAPLLYGFKHFYRGIRVIGVIFNFVSSENHYQFLKEACTDVGLESFGYLPKNAGIQVPSRHLGLSIGEEFLFDEFAEQVAALVEKHIDIDNLLELTARSADTTVPLPVPGKGLLKIAVARDEAFNFMYYENIEHLKRLGEVEFFSPLRDASLPEADLVYLPGGYPELFLPELSNNITMLESIRNYAEGNGKILAECGGMMYLSASIADKEGNIYQMAGVLDQKTTMESMKLKLGYRHFMYKGIEYRGHEFHYSSIENPLPGIVQQYTAKNMPVDTRLIRYKNVIAGYTHLYWANENDITALFN